MLALLNQARSIVQAKQAAGADSFIRSVDAFNAAVERENLGYYLDAEVVERGGKSRVYLASFEITQVRWFRAGRHEVRAFHLRRKDSLNFVRSVLGFTRPHIRDALVLVEGMDSWLFNNVLPALAPEGKLSLVGSGPAASLPEAQRLALRAGQELRRELSKLASGCVSLEATGKVFERRKLAFEALTDKLSRQRAPAMLSSAQGRAHPLDRTS